MPARTLTAPARPPMAVVYDPAVPANDRAQALVAALPPALQEVLAAGRIRQRSRFSEDERFVDFSAVWQPPVDLAAEHVQMARRALMDLENSVLAPSDPAPLLGRVLALLSHFPARGLPPEVEQAVAADWAEDLADHPLWAVEQAARQWRRTRKWRPTIAEMRALCEEITAVERELAKRLATIVKAGDRTGSGTAAKVLTLAARSVRRVA